jgi:hypothetical protein
MGLQTSRPLRRDHACSPNDETLDSPPVGLTLHKHLSQMLRAPSIGDDFQRIGSRMDRKAQTKGNWKHWAKTFGILGEINHSRAQCSTRGNKCELALRRAER